MSPVPLPGGRVNNLSRFCAIACGHPDLRNLFSSDSARWVYALNTAEIVDFVRPANRKPLVQQEARYV